MGKRDNKAGINPRTGPELASPRCQLCSPHANEPLGREEERPRGAPDAVTACSPAVRALESCLCVILKIDAGISRALFVAVKTFNPFQPLAPQDLSSMTCDRDEGVGGGRVTAWVCM